MPRVITAGETMLLGVPSRPGLLRHSQSLELKVGGAESNVAIALSRLGIPSGWISCLGDDEAGQLVLDRVRGEGVDTSQVRRLGEYTGLYLRDTAGTKVRVHYYRAGSAASRMAPGTFDPGYLDGTDFLHLTGITPALSESCADFVRWAAREASARGARVSFDVNYRSKLGPAEVARGFVEDLLPELDLLFVGDDEALALWGVCGEGFARELAAAHPSGDAFEVVLKRGERGSSALVGGQFVEEPGFEVPEVDPIGAGDAHVAGYLAGSLWSLDVRERLRLANAMGAYSMMTLGDYEGLPGPEEIRALMDGKSKPGR
ncbi:MAG: sugar kinase [Rubrobacteraceae bacterium]